MLSKERKEKIVKTLQQAIQIKSYSGEEKGIVEYLKKLLEEIGYDAVHIDHYGNIIACMKGKRKGLKVLMDGHMDTVPAQKEKWKEMLLVEQ
ncbi:peptidase [Fusobacterium necrophorum subsp. necrophorum]|nr:peptidase [Fusobacterium necrophorum subsp. necrophorum]